MPGDMGSPLYVEKYSNLFRRKRNLIPVKMSKTKKIVSILTVITASIFMMTLGGCKKDNPATPPARQTSYNLKAKDVLGVTGTVTFTETSNTITTVSITLTGAPSGTHPAEKQPAPGLERPPRRRLPVR